MTDPLSIAADLDAACLANIAEPSRDMAPVVYYGGKGNLLPRILPLLTGGQVYCEPYCGAASLFFAKRPHPVEVLNDLNTDLVNLFRCLQDPATFAELSHRIIWTPYSVDEFRRALAIQADPAEQNPILRAWSFYTCQNQGFSGTAETEGNWGRAFVDYRGMADTANKWRGRMKRLSFWHDRLTCAQIDNRDALEVIRFWDSPDTLFYLDPPYIAETRVKGKRNIYRHEADAAHHTALVELLLTVKGRVVLSGYDHPIYAPLFAAGWDVAKHETASYAASRQRGGKIRGKGSALAAVPRTECVWTNRSEGRTLF